MCKVYVVNQHHNKLYSGNEAQSTYIGYVVLALASLSLLPVFSVFPGVAVPITTTTIASRPEIKIKIFT